MRDFGRCEELKCEHRIPVKPEKGKKFTIVNPNKAKVRVIRIDGCVITDGLRCDWLFVPEGGGVQIYLELKGSDVGHGIKQLESTIKNPKVTEGVHTIPKYCYIIYSSNSMRPVKLAAAKTRFKREYAAKLIPKKWQAEHNLTAPS